MQIKIYNFSTTGCAQCGLMDSRFNDVLKDYEEIIYEHIYVDKEPKYQTQYQLITSPTAVFLVDNVEVYRVSGIVDRDIIRKELDGILWKHQLMSQSI